MDSQVKEIIRSALGCFPPRRSFPNYRGFVPDVISSRYSDKAPVIAGPKGSASTDAISTPGGCCAGENPACCGGTLTPGYDGNKIPSRLTFGVGSEAPNQPTFLRPIYNPQVVKNLGLAAGCSGEPNMEFVTLTKVALGGAKADVPVQFGSKHRFFTIASWEQTHWNDSLYWHLLPIGRSYAGNAINVLGTEPWLSWPREASAVNLGNFIAPVIELCTPIDLFYLDIGQEVGGGNFQFTILGTDAIVQYHIGQR